MAFATCPGCDENVRISGRPEIGDAIVCQSCGERLQVVSTEPLELDWEFEDEGDWDDDDDDDYDDEEDE